MLRPVFDFFIFSNVYISLCAVLMVYQTVHLFNVHPSHFQYYLFVFFSTLFSYNFHWYLTHEHETHHIRVSWAQRHKILHLVLGGVGLVSAFWFFIQLNRYHVWLIGAALLTFFYTAPKIPLKPLQQLSKIAIGKTIYLAFMWMCVTVLLPLIISGNTINTPEILFCISRFFLIYPICILFDYRDRQEDKKQGIRTMVTSFNEKGIDILFFTSVLIFLISTSALFFVGFTLMTTIMLLLPGLITLCLYTYAKRNFSDYVYYFILDGLMMLSALFTPFLSN